MYEQIQKKINEYSPQEFYAFLLSEIGYLKALEVENTIESAARLENLKELQSAISEYESRSKEPSLSGFLEEVALVENIAQTAAARIGYRSAQEQKPVPVGFIGAVQNLIIYRKAQLGETLYTTIKIKNQIFNATIIEGEVRVDKEIIASCTMKIFIPSY